MNSSHRPVGDHQACHTYIMQTPLKTGEKGTERVFEETMAKTFQN